MFSFSALISLFGSRGSVQRNVLFLGIVSFFTDASSEMIYPLLPVFLATLAPAGQAALYIGLMDGIAESTSALLKIIAGNLSDRFQKRKLPTVIGYTISTLARPAMALATNGLHVIVLRFLDRTGKGIRTPSRDALIRESVDAEHRGLAFSFHRAMDHTGAVAGPLLALAFLFAAGETRIFHFDPAAKADANTLKLLFALALIPGLFSLLSFIPVRDVRSREANPIPATRATGRPRHLPGRLYLFLAAVLVFTLGNSSDLFLVYLAADRFGAPPGTLLLLWVGLHLAKISFSLPGGGLSDRLGRRPLIIFGWLLYGGVYLGLAFAGSFFIYVLLILAYGLYYGATEGAEKALVADFVPIEQTGTAYGLYHASVGLAALPASALFGLLWMVAGPPVAFATGAGLALLASTMLLFLPAHPIVPETNRKVAT